ncbi:hypothetical protein CRUP_022681 [Coryphaenoides rupestris]|nr:hypothetical protein CRUP_022681 [Coryphaenoides rupestris]
MDLEKSHGRQAGGEAQQEVVGDQEQCLDHYDGLVSQQVRQQEDGEQDGQQMMGYLACIILEYEKGGHLRTKSIDLLELSPKTDPDALVAEIRRTEPLVTESRAEQVKQLVLRLKQKLSQREPQSVYLFKACQAHILPLTNVAFNKSGSSFITGSYDRTCRIWDTALGAELHTLEGHRNVVYAIAFNNPYGAETGKCLHTFRGHTAEIVCLAFDPQGVLVATGSMDTTARLWDVEGGEEVATLTGHTAEVITVSFNTAGDLLLTGSFDHTVSLWEVASGRSHIHGHTAEVITVSFNTAGDLLLTGSFDHTVSLWEVASGRRVHTLRGHSGEITNVQLNWDCSLILVYNAATYQCLVMLQGHQGEISKICFSPQGGRVLTASSDKTARLWDVASGRCLQVLEGHTDEIFSCSFITGSYDRTCRIWDTALGAELHTLEGHRNVVYAIAFNNPYGAETGKCLHTFRGHTAEIVCLAFDPRVCLVATGSMDTTARLMGRN